MRKQVRVDKKKYLDIVVDNCIQKGILKDYLSENRRGLCRIFLSVVCVNAIIEKWKFLVNCDLILLK